MSNIDSIDDEDVLHKMVISMSLIMIVNFEFLIWTFQLSATENFDERKKIRARMREVREKKAGKKSCSINSHYYFAHRSLLSIISFFYNYSL
jgi:hypothetical protein